MSRDRLAAFAVHLAVTALVLGGIFWLMRARWYAGPYYELQGIGAIYGILAVSAIVAGPLLTLAVFRRGKKGLGFDLVVIGALQVAALAYGTWTLHAERPQYLVFALDRYNLLGARDVDLSTLRDPALLDAPLPRLLVAEMPMGEAFQRLQSEVLFEGKPDLERRPEHWVAYRDGVPAVLAGARPVGELGDALLPYRPALDRAAASAGVAPAALLYAPVVGKRRDMTAVVAPGTGEVLTVLPLDPYKINKIQ
ncbi:MAG: hypothetical protein P8008_03375 [Gammaproteobacteria bacterium]